MDSYSIDIGENRRNSEPSSDGSTQSGDIQENELFIVSQSNNDELADGNNIENNAENDNDIPQRNQEEAHDDILYESDDQLHDNDFNRGHGRNSVEHSGTPDETDGECDLSINTDISGDSSSLDDDSGEEHDHLGDDNMNRHDSDYDDADADELRENANENEGDHDVDEDELLY